MKNPFDNVALRPGYREQTDHPLVTALRVLRERNELMGCVLITFDGARCEVGVNASGFDAEFGAVMDRLAQEILKAIDGGHFDAVLTLAPAN